MMHELKLDQQYFRAKEAGQKLWEVRENDRDYHVGDLLCYNETVAGMPTGRSMIERVAYLLHDWECPGLQPNYVVMSTEPVYLTTMDEGPILVYKTGKH